MRTESKFNKETKKISVVYTVNPITELIDVFYDKTPGWGWMVRILDKDDQIDRPIQLVKLSKYSKKKIWGDKLELIKKFEKVKSECLNNEINIQKENLNKEQPQFDLSKSGSSINLSNDIEGNGVSDYKFYEQQQENIPDSKSPEFNLLNSDRVLWLEKVYAQITHDIIQFYDVPSMVNINWGWPIGNKKKVRGQVFFNMVDTDPHLLTISPIESDCIQILAILLHEICHIVVGKEAGHRKEFSQLASKIGFTKPWTTANPNEELIIYLKSLINKFGEIPKGKAELVDETRKQTTRLRLWICGCGIKVRVASNDFNATCGVCNTKFGKV